MVSTIEGLYLGEFSKVGFLSGVLFCKGAVPCWWNLTKGP